PAAPTSATMTRCSSPSPSYRSLATRVGSYPAPPPRGCPRHRRPTKHQHGNTGQQSPIGPIIPARLARHPHLPAVLRGKIGEEGQPRRERKRMFLAVSRHPQHRRIIFDGDIAPPTIGKHTRYE